MTREEAVQIINNYYPSSSKGEYTDLRNALNIAIVSLGSWDKVIKDFKMLYRFGKIDGYVIDIIEQYLEEVEDEQVH